MLFGTNCILSMLKMSRYSFSGPYLFIDQLFKEIYSPHRGIYGFMHLVSASLPAKGWGGDIRVLGKPIFKQMRPGYCPLFPNTRAVHAARNFPPTIPWERQNGILNIFAGTPPPLLGMIFIV